MTRQTLRQNHSGSRLKPVDSINGAAGRNKAPAVPLYSQIERSLVEKIKSGTVTEGAPLPSEQDLARYYGVSRMTARQAIQSLKNKGYVVTVGRKGTFVTTPKIEKTLVSLQGFSQEMRAGGMRPSSIVLDHEICPPSDEAREALQLGNDEKVFRLRRLRIADGIPIAVEESCLPIREFPKIDATDFARESLYAVILNKYRRSIGWSEDVIEASKATTEEAHLLAIPRGSSVLSITRVVKSPEGRPIELCHSRYRSDRYRATVRIPR